MPLSAEEFVTINEMSEEEIEGHLRSGQYAAQLGEFLGPATYESMRELARRPKTFAAGSDVVLLPGIMGSELQDVEGLHGKIWVNRLGILASGSFSLLKLTDQFLDVTPGTRLVPVGLLKTSYLKPKKWLESRGHVVHAFPYDWRRPIDSSAILLRETIERIANGDPKRRVVLVAHSMGGLVARRYFDLYPEQAETRVQKLIMLGTPNHGSYVPLMAMKGNYTLLRIVGFLYGGVSSRAVVQSFPGLYEMFPNATVFGQANLFQAGYWNDAAMPQALLDVAQGFHDKVKARVPHKMALIACRTRKTVTRLEREPDGEAWRYRFMGAAVGDGTVPFDSAYLREVDTYEADAEHGSIQKDDDVLRAVDEIIEDGKASSLKPYKPAFAEPEEPLVLEEMHPVAPLLQL